MTLEKLEDKASLSSLPSVLERFLSPNEPLLSAEEFSKITVREMFAAVDEARKTQTDR